MRSFGDAQQIIHRGSDLKILELHVYRGWHIYDSSEYTMTLSPADMECIQVAAAQTRPQSNRRSWAVSIMSVYHMYWSQSTRCESERGMS